jgi:F-type H+-transporting ATPase subunit epsilon
VRLKVLVPTEVVLDQEVVSIVAEGRNGSFGLKPSHIDFVTSLVPGILFFVREQGAEGEYMAVDRGILVKYGSEVFVSVRNAVGGAALEKLMQIVNTRFMILDEQERVVRTAVAKLEADFLRRFMELS